MFSGGVGEYVYRRESRDFGDLGRRLGLALSKRLDRLPGKLLPAGECIRATAFGASEYSVQLSGNTVYISQPGELLPRRNLQVLQPPVKLDGDVANTLGAILKDDWHIESELLVIDGVALRDFDYIDLGRIRMPSHTVPVTIKSLVFSRDPRVPHEHRRPHHHG